MKRLGSLPVVIAVLFASTFGICSAARSEQNTCAPTVIAVNAVLPDGKLIRGLKRESLVAQAKVGSVQIDSITSDIGPRRFLFVLDTGHDLPSDTKKAEAEVASYIVSGADTTDSFALTTARGERIDVHFDEGREKLIAAFRRIEEGPKGPGNEEGALDAVMEALDWFQTPQVGDTIVLMASEIEHNKRTAYSKVTRALADRHTRLFGLLLGPMILGTIYEQFGTDYRGRFTATSDVVANDQNLSTLSWDSGGYLLVENAKSPWKDYKLTDKHLDELKTEAGQLYGAATEIYKVVMIPPAHSSDHEQWKLDLADSIRKRLPQAKILYPRQLPACIPQQTKR
jgi:hypothetical protein